MNVSSIKFAVGSVVLAGGLATSGVASALTLNTTSLTANSVLTISAAAFSNSSAAMITFAPAGNTTQLADSVTIDPVTGDSTAAPVFNLPVTKTDVSIGWDLKITPNNGAASGSALILSRGLRKIYLGNFYIDFKVEQVFADTTINGVTTKIPVYDFDKQAPLAISLKGLTLTLKQTLVNLKLTQRAQDDFATWFGLDPVVKASIGNLDFGTIAIDINSKLRKKVSDQPYVAPAN